MVENVSEFINEFAVTYNRYENMDAKDKAVFLKRRLRNSIAHCHYSVEVRTNDGKINNDRDIWYRFEDESRKGDDKVTMEISFPSFGNIIEDAGEHTIKILKA